MFSFLSAQIKAPEKVKEDKKGKKSKEKGKGKGKGKARAASKVVEEDGIFFTFSLSVFML